MRDNSVLFVRSRVGRIHIVLLLTFAFLLLVMASNILFNGNSSILTCFASTLVGLSFLAAGWVFRCSVRPSPLTRLTAEFGKKSYSMYIIHFLFASGFATLLVRGMGRHSAIIAEAQYGIVFTVSIVCSYVLAIFSGRYIEDVGINFGKRILHKT
jgi:peptidoglycan/LPS O-acetylase OafA/YrhL